MYERVSGTEPASRYTEQQQKARLLLAQAEQLEAEDPQRSAQLYRNAFKLDRSLENFVGC